LEGAYLENQGGSGSFGAHFERRVFFNEFMTASRLKDRRISEFTLALLEGTGWYKPNYLYAEPMTYGKNAGCAFLDTECINRETLEPNFKEFCSPLQAGGIYWTKRGMGYCGTAKEELETDENLSIEFDYWGNKTMLKINFQITAHIFVWEITLIVKIYPAQASPCWIPMSFLALEAKLLWALSLEMLILWKHQQDSA